MQQNQAPDRQYFFVSQSEPRELEESFLWADDVNTRNAFRRMIREVKTGDIIIQYSKDKGYSKGDGGSIIGFAIARSNNYPYKNHKYGEEGHRVNVEQFRFATPVHKRDVIDALYACQPSKYGRFTESKSLVEGYLAKANKETAQIILGKALEIDNSPEQAEIVKKIRRVIGMGAIQPSAANSNKEAEAKSPLQKIFFGAPGTGKSWRIDHDLWGNKTGIKDILEDRKFRTTFHPDYDYAQFVGAYKPMKEGDKITYSFVPQVFAKAYAKAWELQLKGDENKDEDKNVYLVIEEINRGNCAQIFGDIFQLLDRDSEGFSEYAIDADHDFAGWLETDDEGLKSVWKEYESDVGKGKLKLPPNLNILATMNTSDQSLFPMDSAFKRRFDWEYVPIKYKKDEKCGDDWNADTFVINDSDGLSFKWLDFLEKVNADISKATESEDKQMGEFFIRPKTGNDIGLDEFRSKVLFYLWDSVYKDEFERKTVFHFNPEGKDASDTVTYQRLFGDDFVQILAQMLQNLGVNFAPSNNRGA